MLARAPHSGLSLDLLIAEAKRRARQRRVLIALLAVAFLGGGTGLVFGGLAVFRAVRSAPAPYEPGGVITGNGGFAIPISIASLASVAAPSGGGAWIVGSVAWRWDGKAWRSVPLPTVHGTELQSVATVSANDAWAVGRREADQEVHSRGLIEHWDGIRWSVVRHPALRGSTLSTVSAAGPRNVWAAGATFHSKSDKQAARKERPLLLHWDGSFWRKQVLPWSRPGMQLEKVVATGRAGVWAVVLEVRRDSEAIRAAFWNGERWRFVPAPFGSHDPLEGFDATAWNDAWAVGSYREARLSHSLAAHWNGRAWQIVPVPGRPGDNDAELVGVADVKPGDAWAIGESNRFEGDSVTGPAAVFLHWDGKSWRLTPATAPLIGWGGPPSIAAGRDGSVWAIGNCRVDNVVARWTHGTWVVTKHPRDAHWMSSLPATARIRHQKLPTCSAAR